MIKRVLAIFLLCGSGSTALAQDGSEGAAMRTPAAAQRFLAAVAESPGRVVFAVDYGSTRPSAPAGAFAQIAARRLVWVPESECVTRIEISDGSFASRVEQGDLNKAEDANRYSAFVTRTGLPRPPYRIDWRSVRDFERTNDGNLNNAPSPIFRFQGMYLWFLDPAIVERAEFALRFLVERCSQMPEMEGF